MEKKIEHEKHHESAENLNEIELNRLLEIQLMVLFAILIYANINENLHNG